MSGQHRRDAPAPAFAPGRATACQRWVRGQRWGTLLWLGPLVVLGGLASIALASTLVPYRPFVLASYVITPDTVCAGAPVRAEVTREFTDQVTYFRLSESWTTVDVPGFPTGRPITTEAAELPAQALGLDGGPRTVPSPLITEAPSRPGTYEVRIIAEYQGQRWGVLPAIGSETFTSDNQVTVLPSEAPTCVPDTRPEEDGS